MAKKARKTAQIHFVAEPKQKAAYERAAAAEDLDTAEWYRRVLGAAANPHGTVVVFDLDDFDLIESAMREEGFDSLAVWLKVVAKRRAREIAG